MLPQCYSRRMFMPTIPDIVKIARAMPPMMRFPAAVPIQSSSSPMTNEYDSRRHDQYRHVKRDHSRHRHAPFDWYQPPKQGYEIVHEDISVVTSNGPVPFDEFYRQRTNNKHDEDPTVYDESEKKHDDRQESSHEEKTIDSQSEYYTESDWASEEETSDDTILKPLDS
ncbi:unnamed protein product [Rotaria magnacalcarata]|uniref:Uncharacterized protein n=1 Tax=Rotaria magnacalcarata TaxID=392030 RepID=A0A816ZXC8_9BILA|nr:unnamed protein product [Rotaria magnacalcarata]CAF1682266.1 unnamed protein product [Rotaria magnacalcarata]CAF2126460.1 unnamed protein product [Rotaria magnacalcarata]CAF2229127.1 unnamed protein product [Rotaria magnacalcarata]CAF2229701.1 unnamed protein product [Rotaria magnacalcarata]